MNPATIVTITQGVNLVATVGPVLIDTALKFKKLFASDTSGVPFEVQIQVFEDGILKTMDETDAILAAWRATHPE